MRQRVGTLRKALWGVGLSFAGLIGVLTLLVLGLDMGAVGFHVTMLLAFLPVPVYVMLVLWLDRIEREPWYLLLAAFLHGATFATCFGGLVNATFARLFGEAAAITLSAPVFEELFKGLFLLGFFLLRRDEFDGVLDGVIYASMVGLGFACVENLEYYGRALKEGVGSAGVVWVVRGVFSPFAHPLFTSMTGIGFGLALKMKNPGLRVLLPLVGYAVAVVLHMAWNGSAMVGGFGGFAGAYLLIFVPTFVGLILLALYSINRETQIIRDHLLHELAAGRLSNADYQSVGTLPARRADLLAAQRFGGKALRKLRQRFHQEISDLAFYRYRVAHGIHPHDPHLEAEHLRVLAEVAAACARLSLPARSA